MKKLLVALAAVLVTAATYGQGQVNFNNLGSVGNGTYANGAIYRPGGVNGSQVNGAGAGYTAGLFIAGSTIPLGTTTFFTDPGAEYLLNPIDITVPNVASGNTASFEVKAWETSFGSYEAALAGGGARGVSPVFVNKVGGGTLPPENTLFTGFSAVPEPSTIAFGVIGGLALLLRRRK